MKEYDIAEAAEIITKKLMESEAVVSSNLANWEGMLRSAQLGGITDERTLSVMQKQIDRARTIRLNSRRIRR